MGFIFAKKPAHGANGEPRARKLACGARFIPPLRACLCHKGGQCGQVLRGEAKRMQFFHGAHPLSHALLRLPALQRGKPLLHLRAGGAFVQRRGVLQRKAQAELYHFVHGAVPGKGAVLVAIDTVILAFFACGTGAVRLGGAKRL